MRVEHDVGTTERDMVSGSPERGSELNAPAFSAARGGRDLDCAAVSASGSRNAIWIARRLRQGAGAFYAWMLRPISRKANRVSSFDSRTRREIELRLRTFAASFAECHKRTEVEFVALGRLLRDLHSQGSKLAQLVGDHLADLRGVLTESHVGGSDGIAACSLRELHVGLEQTSTQLRSLRTVATELRRLQVRTRVIERVGIFIRSSVFGFAIESARSAECRGTFAAFVQELRSLAEKIASVAEGIAVHVRSTQSTQDRELREMSASLGKLRELAKTLESTAAATAAEAQTLLDSSMLAAQRTSERTQSMARLVHEVVYHLQLGDIVRQKSEHVAATLEQTAQQLSAANSDAEFGGQAVLADRVLEIQMGQLDLIRREVETASEKLTDSFRRLVDQGVQLCADLERRTDSTEARGEPLDPLGGFRKDLSYLEDLHTQCSGLCQEARKAADRAAAASSTLSGHVEELEVINQDMHLQALNAIVKTADLGPQGATLSVLSMHVEWLYRESNQGLIEITSTLDAVLRAAKQDSQSDLRSAAKNGDWITQLRQGISRIETASVGSVRIAAQAMGLAEEQRRMLDGGQARLEFLAQLSTTTSNQIQELKRLREALKPWLQQAGPASATALDSLADRYTMRSEREVHESAAKQNQPQLVEATATPAAAAAAGIAAGEFEDFDLPQAAPVISDSAQMKDLEKPATEIGSALTAPPTPGEASLGDNIELF